MDVRVGLWRRLRAEELMLLNCGVGEDSWESLGLQGDPTSPFWGRSALGFLWREWCKSWNSSTLATSCEELTHWKRLWCWEGLGAGGEGDERGWDGWMALLTRWTWVWVGDGQEAWRSAIHGVAKSRTRLSDWNELNWRSDKYPMTLILNSQGSRVWVLPWCNDLTPQANFKKKKKNPDRKDGDVTKGKLEGFVVDSQGKCYSIKWCYLEIEK